MRASSGHILQILLSFVIVAAVFSPLPFRPLRAQQGEDSCNLSGTWNSTFGQLQLKHNGTAIKGKYFMERNFFETVVGTIEGTVKGKEIEWTWSQDDQDQGYGRWKITADCRHLEGQWGRSPRFEMGAWFANKAD